MGEPLNVDHVPVLVREALDLLLPERGGLVVDCTLGLGGHAERILERAGEAELLGLDRDGEALAVAGERLARFGSRVRLVQANYADLREVLESCAPGRLAAGIFADLGVSSLQLERPERGFSFGRDGPLDMRMGRGDLTAFDVVNEYPEADLERILREYGEERRARRIARAIVREREERPLETTAQLADLVRRHAGGPPPRGRGRHPRGKRIDPATRAFQAVRIEVNRELDGLAKFLDEAVRLLDTEGRLVVISYHSLEDRLVKNALRSHARGEVDEITGRTRSETQLIEVLTKKPLRPTEAEVATNPRSRSGRLRAAKRL